MQTVDESEVLAPSAPVASDRPVHRDRNVISMLVGVVGFFLVWALALGAGGSGGDLNTFVHLPSVLIVIVSPAAVLMAIYGWAGMVDAVCWIFRKPGAAGNADDAITFFQLAAAFALATGFLGTLCGLVLMLANLSDPSSIGPSMAMTLLTQLYGVFVAVVCIAAAAYIARRHQCVATAKAVGFRAASVAGITTIAGTLTVLVGFCILMLSLSPAM